MGAGLEWGVGQSTQGVHEGETVLANSTIARHPGQCGDRPVCPHRAGRHPHGQAEGGGQHRPGTRVQRGGQGCAQECRVL